MTNTLYYSGTELDSFIEARNYYRTILKFFRPYVGDRVLEVGAGIGTFSSFLLGLMNVRELTTLEPAVNLFPLLDRRFSEDSRVKCVNGYLHDYPPSEDIDTVVSINVLEHIENDGGFLRSAQQVLAPGGTILLFTPAMPMLYGSLDRQFGHNRRYTKRGLAQELRSAGFSLESLRYFDLPGILGWFLATRILKRNTLLPDDVRHYDRFVFSWSSKIESWWEPPIGKNLLAIGRKPKRDA
jgi:2-polyprenyl-3-methyl-5-hydroxy-6-metoxy-1,4-benzoquinol methylase